MKPSSLAVEAHYELHRRGSSVTKLARELGCSREHLSLVLNGRRAATPEFRRSIARRLGPRIGALLLAHGAKVTPVTGERSTAEARR